MIETPWADASASRWSRAQEDAVVLATWVGRAAGARAAAAALACAGAEPDDAALLVDLSPGRPPRPALVTTLSARKLEERLAVHIPEARVASRGHICHLAFAADETGLEQLPGALAVARGSAAVVHLPPDLMRAALEMVGVQATAALLRADLAADAALAALVARDLIEAGLTVGVLKRQLPWLASRRALFGIPAGPGRGLPPRLLARLLGNEKNGSLAAWGPIRGASPRG